MSLFSHNVQNALKLNYLFDLDGLSNVLGQDELIKSLEVLLVFKLALTADYYIQTRL